MSTHEPPPSPYSDFLTKAIVTYSVRVAPHDRQSTLFPRILDLTATSLLRSLRRVVVHAQAPLELPHRRLRPPVHALKLPEQLLPAEGLTVVREVSCSYVQGNPL